jgi:hypothetical protein
MEEHSSGVQGHNYAVAPEKKFSHGRHSTIKYKKAWKSHTHFKVSKCILL